MAAQQHGFDAGFGVRAQRFPCNFASRTGIAEGRWSRAPLHEVSPSSAATGIGAQERAEDEAWGKRISIGRMRPS